MQLQLFIGMINTMIDSREKFSNELSQSEKDELQKLKKCRAILLDKSIPIDD